MKTDKRASEMFNIALYGLKNYSKVELLKMNESTIRKIIKIHQNATHVIEQEKKDILNNGVDNILKTIFKGKSNHNIETILNTRIEDELIHKSIFEMGHTKDTLLRLLVNKGVLPKELYQYREWKERV